MPAYLISFRLYFYLSIRAMRQEIRALHAIELGVAAGLVFMFSGLPGVATAESLVRSGVVTRVVDGDTLWVRDSTGVSGGKTLKVRIVGIDAPEVCQAGGPEAREALRLHVLGLPVTLTSPSSRSHDDYGRLLARVDKQGEDVGRWMVRHGQAWSYSYRRNPGPYVVEQAHAQAAGTGLFARTGAENPRDFRKRHGSCHP